MGTTTIMIEQIKKLPVLPQVAMKAAERMQSPTATVAEIAGLLQSDIGLASKILLLANSSYYSIPGGVSDVSKALQYLGFTTIAQIVLTTSVIGVLKGKENSHFSLEQFWKHSFAVGLTSEITAKSMSTAAMPDVFICGLMHDMGKLILLEIAEEQFNAIIRCAKENQIGFCEAEKQLGFVNHAELGVHLAEHWNLPKIIINAIRHHHDEKPETKDQLLVAWANSWVQCKKIGHSGNYSTRHEEIELDLAKKLGLSEKQKEQISLKFEIEFEKAGAILNGHS